jgi:GTP-binding protein
MSNIVAIVGRPNVGKSTLFNRLTQERKAIVEETSGVTRDRHYGKSDWNGKEFWVIDTGGYVVGSEDVFEEAIREQVLLALNEADVIVFLVDSESGITSMDEGMADIVRRVKKKTIVAVNKVDNSLRTNDIYEFYQLGFEDVIGISAMNGSGTGDLLDEVVKELDDEIEEEESNIPRLAVVGRPNVGKSSIINAFLGEERNIVTPISGTTRDTIHTPFNKFGYEFLLVDTAGIRKKRRVQEDIEFYSVLRSIRAIEGSDVCILMIDATQGIEAQDLSIYSLIIKNKKGVVVVVNKWDLVENKETNTHLEMERNIREKLAPFTDVPILFTSVPKKQRILKVLELAQKVNENRTRKISTSKLNEIFLPIIQKFPPPRTRGYEIKIKYITQLKTHYPTFAFFSNFPQYIKEPYKRFLENQLRKHYDFTGSPIQIYIRKK